MSNQQGKVIIIEDEEMVRLVLGDFLTDDGFGVTTAGSAEVALELVKETRFHVAIVDIRLPGMDGDSFIKEAQALQPEMKFIIHTGSPQFSMSQELRDLGIVDEHLFLKPISDMTIISRAVKKLVEEATP